MFLSKLFKPRPFNDGYLPEIDGHRVYFWEFGNPKGKVILCTHGGPGYYSQPKHAMDVDLDVYRVILFDQRGCGKSLPFGKIENNTTQDTIKDMARLLDFLGVKEKIIIKGGSFASTIALLFAEAYPERVGKVLISMIFLADDLHKKWFYEESAKFYPDVMDKIKASNKTKKSLAQDCFDKLSSGDDAQILDALSNFGSYERVVGELDPKIEVTEYDETMAAYAKIFMYYEVNDFFLSDNQIAKNIKKIENIPTLIMHNRMDFDCLVVNAYRLHKMMPNSKLVIVPDMGHGSKMMKKVWKKEIKEFLK